MVTRRVLVALVGVLLATAWVVLVPPEVIDGSAPLLGFALLASGAALSVGRSGMVDLSLGGVAGVGAYAGGVSAAELGIPGFLGIPLAASAGAGVGALVGAILGRVGRTAGALASLAVGTALVTLLSRWPRGGGVSGYHAVPFLSTGARADVVVLAALVVACLLLTRCLTMSSASARSTVAVASPAVASSLGVSAPRAAGVTGAAAGAVVGLGGLALATATGSVAPSGFGLPLAAAVVLAGLLGGAPPYGPLIATVLLAGVPAVAAPGPFESSGLVVSGAIGIVLLVLRRGAPLVAWGRADRRMDHRPGVPLPRRGGPGELVVDDMPAPGGRAVSLRAASGEIVALAGPNGSGKSTVLARIAGQLRDHGAVSFRGVSAPPGARRRAVGGMARTWQRDPEVPAGDLVRSAITTEEDAAAYHAAAALVGSGDTTAQLLALAARRPAVALLDEPGANHPPVVVAAFLRHLARSGTAVVVAEHRPEILRIADRVVRLGDDRD